MYFAEPYLFRYKGAARKIVPPTEIICIHHGATPHELIGIGEIKSTRVHGQGVSESRG